MYALIHNNQIQVGPRQWLYSMFKDYMDEEELDSSALPRQAPTEPIITDTWKLLPVEPIAIPSYDPLFEQLAGPYLTIGETSVTGNFDVASVSLEFSKGKMKEIVTANRYIGENQGTTFTFADGQTVNIYTNREDRGTYLQAYQIVAEGSSISFKFPGAVFRTVTKAELGQIVDTGAAWIQAAFDWETTKYAAIDAAQTVEELKAIELQNPAWVKENAS